MEYTTIKLPVSDEDYKNLRDANRIPPYLDKLGVTEYGEIWDKISSFCKDLEAKRVLELGTRQGNSTAIFAEAIQEFGGTVFTVDMEDPKWEKQPFPNIHVIKANVKDFTFLEPVDILFIDDDHDDHHVYYELEKFGHLAKVIMLHDVFGEENSEGIREAIAKWSRKYHRTFMIIPGFCGLGMIFNDPEALNAKYVHRSKVSDQDKK